MLTLVRPNNEAEKNRLQLSRSTTSSLVVPTPKDISLFEYQRAGVEYALMAKNTLFADPPGVGKTIQTIGFMNVKRLSRVLVICPTSVVHNWEKEIKKWSIDPLTVHVFNPRHAYLEGKPNVLIMSYYYVGYIANVQYALRNGPYEHLIIDECHFLKNPKAKRTKHVLAVNGLRGHAENIHAISGTPIVNRPIEIYPVVKSLCPEAISNMSYFEYGVQYCGGFESKWGWDFNGSSNLHILGMKLRSNFMIRREKKDVLKELPEKFPPNLVYIDESDDAKTLVKKMNTYDEDLIIRGTVSPEFTEISALRKELGIEKVKKSVEYIVTALESGHEKIVVLAHHVEVISRLKQALEMQNYKSVLMTGATSAKERDENVELFQTDKSIRVFIASVTAAIGVTLHAASYNIFVEFSWVPGQNQQAIDRTHRIGQTRGVMTDFLVYENSLDERILKKNLEKEKNIKEVMQ